MSHDIGFYDHKTEQTIIFFFGYAQGIFYQAFNAEHCNNGFSGANQGVVRSADQVKEAIELIKASDVYTNYPDPDRIPTTVRKLEEYLKEHPDCNIFIHFS